MKLYNPFKRIKELNTKNSELREELRSTKNRLISQQHKNNEHRVRIENLNRELKHVKRQNNKLIGDKYQILQEIKEFRRLTPKKEG